MKSLSTYRAEARAQLNGHWGESAMIVVLYYVVNAMGSVLTNVAKINNLPNFISFSTFVFLCLGLLFFLFVQMPSSYALFRVFLLMRRNPGKPLFETLKTINYKRALKSSLIYLGLGIAIAIFMIIGLLLLIFGIKDGRPFMSSIGGILTICSFALIIIYALYYTLYPFVSEDNMDLSAWQAFCLTGKIMQGNELRFFLLYLSFIGWSILSVFTLGVGLLFLTPYVNSSFAAFYEDIKADFIHNNPTNTDNENIVQEDIS